MAIRTPRTPVIKVRCEARMTREYQGRAETASITSCQFLEKTMRGVRTEQIAEAQQLLTDLEVWK